jgi:hypothetical protein
MQKMLGVMFGVMCAVSVGCMASSDDRDDPAATASDPSTSSSESDVTVPPELQMISPRATCASEGFSCVSRNLCVANDGQGHAGTGCATGTICCSFNQCINAGGSCVIRNLCTANDGTPISRTGCASGKICCLF